MSTISRCAVFVAHLLCLGVAGHACAQKTVPLPAYDVDPSQV